jgi:hypothetical protein
MLADALHVQPKRKTKYATSNAIKICTMWLPIHLNVFTQKEFWLLFVTAWVCISIGRLWSKYVNTDE